MKLSKRQIRLLLGGCWLAATGAAQETTTDSDDGQNDPATFFSEARRTAASTPEPAEDERPERSFDIGCGTVVDVSAVDGAVLIRDLDAALLAGRLLPGEEDSVPLLRRTPDLGNAFVVVSLRLTEGCSVGKYDYVLEADGQRHKCLALSRDLKPFDPRAWECVYDDDGARIKLLFEIPDHVRMAALAFNLPPPPLPVPQVQLSW